MAKKTAREIADEEAKGLYKQKHRYWYRYWNAGKEHYHNCQTTNLEEAKEEKKRFLASERFGKALADKSWEKEVEAHVSERKAKGTMKESTEKGVRSVINVFRALFLEVKRPEDVRYEHLEKFWVKARVDSDSTGKTYLTTFQSFLNERGLLRRRFKIPKTANIGSRDVYEDMEVINKWIEGCADDKLKYVLFCLAHMGLRSGEVKYSRVEWFRDGLCRIPVKMAHKLKSGKRAAWSPKDGEDRQIPLTPEFQAFLNKFLVGKKDLVLQSKKSKSRTWDFRLPFERYMVEVGATTKEQKFFPHAFRHSWMTYLMQEGYSIQQVALWSGDRIETIQKHYWKKHTEAGSLDVTGKRKLLEEEKKKQSLTDIINEAVAQAVSTTVTALAQKAKEEEKEVNLEEALKDVIKQISTPDFVEELAAKYSQEVIAEQIDDEERQRILDSIPN
jgi:integrase